MQWTAKRETGDKVTEETPHFISSLDANNPKHLKNMAQAHWVIENNLNWVLEWL
jgi:predicted transposase YbfD/YdcC